TQGELPGEFARRWPRTCTASGRGGLRDGVDHQDQPAGDPEAVASRIGRSSERNVRETRLKRRDRVARVLTPPLPGPTFRAAVREANVRRGFFEAEDFESVRRRLSPDLADFVSFLYTTGWRWRCEAARLRWTNIAFDAGEVRLEPGTTKTGEGRVFPFTADLR